MLIINKCSIHNSEKGKYYPTFYLPNALLMAIYGSLIDPVPYVPFQREQIKVDEKGGTINLDQIPINHRFLDENGNPKDDMRTLVILHGLTVLKYNSNI